MYPEWTEKTTYGVFRELLGMGLNLSLEFDEISRTVIDVGLANHRYYGRHYIRLLSIVI